MTERVALALPCDPVLLLNSNQRLHHHQRAQRTKFWRGLAFAHADLLDLPTYARARITVTYTFPDKRRRDVGNLYPTSKALVDGLVDAGVLDDDNDGHLIGPDQRANPERGPHGIRIDIEEIK